MPVTLHHAWADLGGIAGHRLTDPQALAGLLLSAANAAALDPAGPPVVKTSPRGVSAVLACSGGHVTLHADPESGACFVDVAGVGKARPQRGVDVIVKRLGARAVRSDAASRGAVHVIPEPERL